MNNNTENVYKEAKDLETNSRRVKTAHFNAAHRKQIMHRILGIKIIAINIIIFCPLLNLINSFIPNFLAALSVKFLAIFSASLAGIQTTFNFQKDVEMHLSAGDIYASIYHKVGTLLAKYRDDILQRDNFVEQFEVLQQDYFKANTNYKSCIPSNEDYKGAKESLKKRDEQ